MQSNKFTFAKSCLAGAVALALLAGCGGGGGGGGGKKSGSNDNDNTSQPVTVSGAAAKGIIKNGVVRIYRVTNGARGALLGEGRTSATNGTYSVNVSGYSGPAIVEITALGAADEGYPSLMVCDIPGTDSCHDDVDDANDIGFGEDYALGETFALKAVVPAVSGQNVTANVTALTDLAASLAEENGITADSVHIANTQVANLFDLMGDITALPVVDVTDTAAVAASNNPESLKAALLSAALLAAAKADGNTIESASSAVATNFVANNGQLVQNEAGNTTTTLAEILAQAETLIAGELAGIEALDQISSDISTEQQVAANAPAGTTTNAQPSEENLSDGFLKAKGLVQDLRDLSTAASFEEIQTGSTAFAENLEVASDLIQEDAGYAVEALSLVATAIAEAAQEEAQGPTYTAENGIVIQVSSVEGVPTYSFDDTVTVSGQDMAVELTGSGVFTVVEEVQESGDDENWSESGTETITVDLSLVGVVENAAVSLVIREGSDITVTDFLDVFDESGTDDSREVTESFSVGTIGFNLNVELTQKEGEAPVTFSGSLGATLNGYAYSREASDNYYNCDFDDEVGACTASSTNNSVTDFDNFTLSLAGEFSQGEESFSAALTINAENNSYQLVENDSWSHFWQDGSGSVDEYEELESEETANAFVRVNFTLNLEATLAGISDEVSVEMTGNRNAFRTGAASLRLRYEGKTIDANLTLSGAASARVATLTITNNQGATLTIVESNIDDDNDSYSGVIRANGAQQATVVEERDIILIRYNGGYVETF